MHDNADRGSICMGKRGLPDVLSIMPAEAGTQAFQRFLDPCPGSGQGLVLRRGDSVSAFCKAFGKPLRLET
jgi:hypothetical protein